MCDEGWWISAFAEMTAMRARMDALYQYHRVTLPFMGMVSNPNRCTDGGIAWILPTRGRMAAAERGAGCIRTNVVILRPLSIRNGGGSMRRNRCPRITDCHSTLYG